MILHHLANVTSLLFIVTACGGSDGSTGPSAELRIISGSGQTDTAAALLPIPLVLEIRSNGDPVENVSVRIGDNSCPIGCSVVPIHPGTQQRVLELTQATNQLGRVSVNLALNNTAGAAALPITVTSLNLTDTLAYTIEPANPVGISLAPSDSALYISNSYSLRAALVDQWGNSRTDPITLGVTTPGPVTVSPAGLVTASQYGRAQLSASGAGFSAVAYVSVVPTGTVAISKFELPSFIDIINLDGSGRRRLVETGVLYGGAAAWSPDGQTIAYHASTGGGGKQVHTIAAAGGTGTPLLPSGLGFAESDTPQFSSDGLWIYFHAWTHATLGGEIWRIHPDGTGAERVGPVGAHDSADAYPSPSPDGSQVAFISNRGHQATSTVRVLTIGGGEVDLGTEGLYPRWSPTGEWIAYWKPGTVSGEGSIWLIQPDGGNDHQISANTIPYLAEGLTWSPDGEWVMATGPGHMSLIQISSGLWMPLFFTNLYFYPGWSP